MPTKLTILDPGAGAGQGGAAEEDIDDLSLSCIPVGYWSRDKRSHTALPTSLFLLSNANFN